MDWYYAQDGKQLGPVNETSLQSLVASGVIRPATLVWRQGMANWQPFSSVGGSVAAAAPAPYARPVEPQPQQRTDAPTRFCTQCGRKFPAASLMQVGAMQICPDCRPAFGGGMPGPAPVAGAVRYGGFWIRFVARIIDAIILMAVGFVLSLLFIVIPGSSDVQSPLFWALIVVRVLLSFVIAVAYETYMVHNYGGSLGKLALGLRIITVDGQTLSYGRAAGRYFATFLSSFILCIGYIIAAFDDQKRALHDHIASTRVIYK